MLAACWAFTGTATADPPKEQSAQPGIADLLAQMLRYQDIASAHSTATTPETAPEPLDSSSITATDTGLLEVHVRDTSIVTVLEMLSYQARTNIVATKSVTGAVSANLYGLTLEEALDAVLKPNGYDYRQVGKTYFAGTAEEIAAQSAPPLTRIFKLRYITKGEALNAVNAMLGPNGSASEGGDTETSSSSSSSSSSGSSGVDDEATDASVDYVIVTDTPDNLEAIAAMLDQIDVRPKQVLIEATILRATLTEGNEFGIDFTLLGGIDFQNVSSTSNASTDITTGATPPAKFEQTTFNVNTDLLNGISDGGFTFGIIKNGVATFIRALEEVTDTAVVANPKIIALNKQKAEVIVGRRDGYLTTTVTETAAVQTVEFLETGTQIQFCPFINEDGTVRLSVHPKDSNGGLTAANLPFEETTEAQASILVDDGHTILIGGLFRERNVSSKGQVPVLGNIPGVGLLFQSRNDTTVREEVIILLTVHVLKETEEEYARYAALLEDVERIRIGSRRGLLGTGRERLAQAFYQEAVRQAELGHNCRALLNTRMTLHNQPKHLAALKLKERLLNKRLWDNEGTRMRLFLFNLINQEHMTPAQADQSGLLGRPPLDLKLHRDTVDRTGPASREEQP